MLNNIKKYLFSILFLGLPGLLFPQSKIEEKDTLKTIFRSELVITGTKTFKRKTDSPVMVNVLESKNISNVQACNLSEALKFQPGLRIETNCQTCNYSQLRMNGLQGGYSQILFNGRPVFSTLMGLYGLEQIPSNLIDRIEIVRGGGSSLYGSSAIGGTVNVITKIPQKNGGEFQVLNQLIGYQTSDYILFGNGTWLNEKKNFGVTAFVNQRRRGFYDANRDGFSELSKIKLSSMGVNGFYLGKNEQKLEIAFSAMDEFRLGGDQRDLPFEWLEQVEKRQSNVFLGSIDYQKNFHQGKSSLILFAGFQMTNRNHLTGILPDDSIELVRYQTTPPFGSSFNQTFQGGAQFNHRVKFKNWGTNVFTVGTEYLLDSIFDQIPSYRYLVRQKAIDWGTFFQSDWEIRNKIILLSGFRFDFHNFLQKPILSPRVALLVKSFQNTQIRLNYGNGFRAPQAFDTDLHTAFAGGGVSRVLISPGLGAEKSRSLSASINYDYPTEKYIFGATIESFSTILKNVFVLENTGVDSFGEIFEKRNGSSANVQGITFETRFNYAKKLQLEAGFTTQRSYYQDSLVLIQGLPKRINFLRTPNNYGYSVVTFDPNSKWSFNGNAVFTGKMEVAHFGGAIGQPLDRFVSTKVFWELNGKVTKKYFISEESGRIEVFVGVKNILNDYQKDFDRGKNRDSNYIYGPLFPRTYFVGVKWVK